MQKQTPLWISIALSGLLGCGAGKDAHSASDGTAKGVVADAHAGYGHGEGAHGVEQPVAAEGDWSIGDTIPSGKEGVADIEVLTVHRNGTGEPCGNGKEATLKYTAMLADGTVIDPGTSPWTFTVGNPGTIAGWHVIVAAMRVGDSLTVTCPQELAYGPGKGDLRFDMELLSYK